MSRIIANNIRHNDATSDNIVLDSAGRVILGQADATGVDAEADDLIVSSTAHTGITVRSGSSHNASVYFADQDAVRQGRIEYNHTGNYMRFNTNGTEELRILNGGGLSITNGNLILSSGSGIDFSANGNAGGMTSELLDDYEEGTFSVGISSGVTSPGYTNSYGTYTKIGNCVYFTIRMQVSSGTNNSSWVQLSTLPFTASSTSGREGSASFGFSATNDSSFIPTLHIPTNSTQIHFYHPNGGLWNGNTGNGIVGRTLHMRGFYFV